MAYGCKFCRPPLLQSLIKLFELPEDNAEAIEEHFTELEPEEGGGAYQAVYSQLVFAGKNNFDPLRGKIQDPHQRVRVEPKPT